MSRKIDLESLMRSGRGFSWQLNCSFELVLLAQTDSIYFPSRALITPN
jgi:hypothetical protein